MSKSKQKQSSEKSRSGLYTAIGAIIVILVAALLIWNSGILERRTDAVTMGEYTYDVAEVDFYYYTERSNASQTAYYYSQLGLSYGFDPNISDAGQMYDETMTYADYFRQTALEQLQQVTLLVDQAEGENYALSEDGKQLYDEQMSQLKSQITYGSLMRGSSEASYIKALYGPHATARLMEKTMYNQVLASDYSSYRYDLPTYEDAEVDAYYEENSFYIDNFTYREAFIYAEPEVDVDEEGNELAATEEQTAAAMDVAKSQAESVVSLVTAQGVDLNDAVLSLAEDDAASEESAENSGARDLQNVGSAISDLYVDWFLEDDRTIGDVGIFEAEGLGYYVLEYVDRELDEETLQYANVWSVTVSAETTEETDAEGNVSYIASEAQVADAKAIADEIMLQWEISSTERSEEAFRALVEPYATDDDADHEETDAAAPAVSILSKVSSGSYGTDFDAAVFGPDVEVGSCAVVPITGSNGITGYRFLYVESFGPLLWRGTILDTLRNDAFDLWYDTLVEEYEIISLAGMAKVGG